MNWAKNASRVGGVAAAMLVVTLAACSSGTPKANPTPPATPATTAPAPSTPPATAPAPGGGSSTASTPLDPCKLVTQQDASTLTGVSFGPGKLETESGSKRCVYGANTHNVFEVFLAQAASVDEAKGYAAQLRSEFEAQLGGKLSIGKLSGVGDDAEQLSGSLSSIAVQVAGVYVRKGRIGFAMVDETNGKPPTVAAMVAQAKTVMDQLP